MPSSQASPRARSRPSGRLHPTNIGYYLQPPQRADDGGWRALALLSLSVSLVALIVAVAAVAALAYQG